MLESEDLFCDILVIGSGIAGVRAAIEARAEGLSVLLVSKGPTGRQSSSFYAGGLLRIEPEEVKDVIGYEKGIQKYLYNPELAALYSGKQAVKEVESLISLGIPLEKQGIQYMPSSRGQGGPGGSAIMVPLVKKALDMGIICLGNKIVTDFLLSDGQVKGALAMDERGKLLKIAARATILATGGGAGIFKHNSNPEGITGNGYVLALRAGATLQNMEFVHFYPIGLVGSVFPHRRASPTLLSREGAMLVNSKGEDLVQKQLNLTLQRAIDIPTVRFEMLSRIVSEENRKDGAYLDLTGIPQKTWDTLLKSAWNKAYFDKAPVDLRKERCPVIPLAHTFLGGVKINIKNETSVPGLFAAGEVVGGAYCGEEGASQLCRCLIMGAIAGRYVIPFVKKMKSMRIKPKEWEIAMSRIAGVLDRSWTVEAEEVKNYISRIVNDAMGPVRDGPPLEKGIKQLEDLDQQVNSIKVGNTAHLQNALEAENMAVLAKALLGAAYQRKESRGPHFRSDFPHKDDSWFKRILVSMDKNGQLKFAEEKA